MLRSICPPFVVLAILIVASSLGWAEGGADPESNGTNGDVDQIAVPSNLKDLYSQADNPPIELGDTGDRIRELQATLNMVLADRLIPLGKPISRIYVGPAEGPHSTDYNNTESDTLRLVVNAEMNKAFKIRGHWVPYDSKEKRTEFERSNQLKRIRFIKLPEAPLKIDGIFGEHTQAAVMLFQLEQSLPVTGHVDAVTLDKLEPMIPTDPLLAFIMARVKGPLDEKDENYPYLVKTITSLWATLIILLGAAVVYQFARTLANSTRFLSRWLFTPESSPWFTALRENRVFRRAAQFAPAIFIYLAGKIIFPAPDESSDLFPYLHTFQDWHLIISHFGLAYVSLVFMIVGFGVADTVDSIANPDHETQNPIGSIIRASKRLIGFLGSILILASLAGKSPFIIIGGLGAFMAVFMLVFKDYLLGLVSSVQIIANRVVQIGDWVTLPKYNADGDVMKISLTLIKVQNSDKTISTIPTSAVLSESFQNWSGMQKSGGRRIKRSILVSMRKIQVCTPEMISRFQRIELIHDYIEGKKAELEEYNRSHDVEASPVNSRRLTNIGTFRAYLDAYLRNHPGLNKEMTILVRHLQPTGSGLPIEIYAYCNRTEWAKYEAIQADILDHILAILPEFGLQAFQELTESQADVLPAGSSLPRMQAGLAELESLVEAGNRELASSPRARPATRVQKIRKRIEDLDLGGQFDVEEESRSIVLKHL